MIVKKLGKYCLECKQRYEPTGKFQRFCNRCQEMKIRRFANNEWRYKNE